MTPTKELLTHWFCYYGKLIFTLAELEEFQKIIDDYGAEKVADAAVASYITADGSPTIMLGAIRTNRVKELFDTLPTFEDNVKKKEQYQWIKEEFLRAISADF